MGLIDQIIENERKGALSTLSENKAQNLRRDTSTAIDGAASIGADNRGPLQIVKGRFNTGLWKNVVGGAGSGLQAVGVDLQHPRRELTVKEYQSKLAPLSSIADNEKQVVHPDLYVSHEPTMAKPQTNEDLLVKGHSDSDIPYFYDPEISVLTGKPVDLTEGIAPRSYKSLEEGSDGFKELSPMQQNAIKAQKYIGKNAVSAGEYIEQFADKIIKENPQWELPNHLKGRGVLESLKADDLSFGDKALMFFGGIAEQTPQVFSTVGSALLGGALGGVPGALGGASLGLGQNFLMESGHVYDDLKHTYPNISEEDLARTSLTHGVVATALELAPIANILNDIPGLKNSLKQATLRELIRKPRLTERMAKSMAMQGITEGITEPLQEISANAAKAVYEQNPEYFKGADEAAFMGFVMGTLTGGFASIATHKSAIKRHNEERLYKLDSKNLVDLAMSPDMLQQEGLSKDEVLEVLDARLAYEQFARHAQGTFDEVEQLNISVGKATESESELAARLLASIRNPMRAQLAAKVRQSNLTDEQLTTLVSDEKALKRAGLDKASIEALQQERADEKVFMEHFESILDKAPNDEVRRGIMDTLQGEYFTRMSNIIDARGKSSISKALETKPEETKTKAKPKEKVEEVVEDTREAETEEVDTALDEESGATVEVPEAAEETTTETFDSKAPVTSDNLETALSFSNQEYKRIKALGNTPEARAEWGRYSALRRKINKELANQGREKEAPKPAYGLAVEATVTREEAETEVSKILGSIPDFIKISEQMDPKVTQALEKRVGSPLLSKRLTVPNWTSRLETEFIDKANHKTAEHWITAIQQWTTDKEKKGKIIPASMPSPVQEELTWSGLPEWLEGKEGNVSKEEIKSFLAERNRLRLKEEIQGYNPDMAVYSKAFNEATKEDVKLQDSIQAEFQRKVNAYNDDNDAETHQMWVNLYDQALNRHTPENLDSTPDPWQFFESDFERSIMFTQFDHRLKVMTRKEFNATKRTQVLKEAKDKGLEGEEKHKYEVEEAKKHYKEKLAEFREEVKDILKRFIEVGQEISRKGDKIRRDLEKEYGRDILSIHTPSQWDSMVLAGKSEAYREHLFNLPTVPKNTYLVELTIFGRAQILSFESMDEAKAYIDKTNAGFVKEGLEPALTYDDIRQASNDIEFKGGHFSDRNNLIHLRADVRNTISNETLLFINELQSDWHQQGRQRGINYTEEFNRVYNQKTLPAGIELVKVLEERLYDDTAFDRDFINADAKRLSRDMFQFMQVYHRGKASLAEDIRNLNNVAFKDQIKRIIKQERLNYWTMETWQQLKKDDFDVLQEYLAASAEALAFDGEIPAAPMSTTWETYALKRMVQQAVYEGRDFLAWPKTPKQVAQIERWGRIYSLTNGKHVRVNFDENIDHLSIEELTEFVIRHEKRDKLQAIKNLLIPGDGRHYSRYTDLTPIVERYVSKLGRIAKKQFKKYGIEMTEITLSNDDVVQGFKITPELREAVYAGLPLASETEVVQGAYHEGQIHLASDNLGSLSEVKGLLVHEGGHFLRRNDPAYQKKYNQLVERFKSIAIESSDSAESIAVNRAWQKALRDKDVLDSDTVLEEAMMYFLQDKANTKLTLWQSLINLIKQWIHRTFGVSPEALKMSGAEMAELIINDLKAAAQEKQDANKQAIERIKNNSLAAKKRDDIREYRKPADDKMTPADVILNQIFSKPPNRREAERALKADELEMSERLSNKSKSKAAKKIAKVHSALVQGANTTVKEFVRKEHEQTTSWVHRVLSSPEYYFDKDDTARRILEIANKKNDNKFAWKNRIEGDFIPVVDEIQKRNPAAYTKANKYLVSTDKTGIGFFIKENDEGRWEVYNSDGKLLKDLRRESYAVAFMINAEQQLLRSKRWNKDALTVVRQARMLTNRGFDLTVKDMRRQIVTAQEQGIPEPTIVHIDDEGVRSDIALSEAISRMGDLRGTYFPRERTSNEYTLQAKGKNKTNQLHTFDGYIPLNEVSFDAKEWAKNKINRQLPIARKMRELEKLGYTEFSITPARSPSGMVFDVPGLLMSMDALLSSADEMVSEADMLEADRIILKAASEQLSLRIADIYKAKGSFTSRMRRKDILWEGYEEDALKALTSYAQRAATGAAMRETARDMLLTFTGRDVSWKQYKEENPDAEYKEYRKYVRQKAIHPRYQKKLYEDVRTYMSYILSPDTQVDRIIGYIKAGAVLKFLGFRVSSAAINTTNMAMAVPATISAHTGLSLGAAWKHIGITAAKYARYRQELLLASQSIPGWVARKSDRLTKGMKLTVEDREIFNEISRRGWDEAQFNHDAARVLQERAGIYFDKVLQAAMYMFGVTEKANRAMTIHAAYMAHKEALVREGKDPVVNKEMLLRAAQHTSNRAHGIYGKAAKPWLVQKYSFVDLPYTFQKFSHNYLLNMWEIGIKGHKRDKPLEGYKNIMYMLLTPALVAGAGTSLVVKSALEVIGMLMGTDDPEEDFYRWFDEVFGEGEFTSRLVRHGVVGAVGHVNLRGSLEMNFAIPTETKDILGAPFGVWTDLGNGILHMTKGEFQKGIEKISPTAFGAMIKAQREYDEGVTTNNYAPVYYGTEPLKANGLDAALRALSFNPSRLSAIRQRQWKELKVAEAFTKRRSEIKRQINRHIVDGTWNDTEIRAEIFNQIREYNDRAFSAHSRYDIVFINEDWIANAIKSSYRPDKRERKRIIPGER